ncbi:Hcp family type VI secretion system effector [Mixta intestinalis]|jgi:type VI secretion system secreted protein Hcp|uniref:Type VI secretion system tube protein Hcp n=1 Tax=Mixta intestinalis TaxID=1615494 RepID=A0A6P1Q549_9GAMM|nr:type VI secretion system tube protein Hcp [Mixta intestinalis]QHM73522.1 hypothetical protein C7M51_03869 [Mixta intestinalis]
MEDKVYKMYLKIDGVEGECREALHQGWIEVEHYSYSFLRDYSVDAHGKPTYSPLSVSCRLDRATVELANLISNEETIKELVLSAWSMEDNSYEVFRLTLENVQPMHLYMQGGFGMEGSLVNYEFQGSRYIWQHWKQGENGEKGSETRSGWDYETGTVYPQPEIKEGDKA